MTDQVKEAVEQRELDVLWLESLKESGHCGEGTLEYRSRAHWNDRIDRLLSELSRLSKLVEEAGDGLDMIERKISALTAEVQQRASLTHKTIKGNGE